MQTTIIKHNPGERRGRMHGYTITVIRDGQRMSWAVLALNGRKALESTRAKMGDDAPKVLA